MEAIWTLVVVISVEVVQGDGFGIDRVLVIIATTATGEGDREKIGSYVRISGEIGDASRWNLNCDCSVCGWGYSEGIADQV